MPNIFFVSDTHFGHEKTCTTFKRPDGSPLRPFSCAQEMDEEMVRRWNDVVKPGDKVYHLGDVVINKKFLPIMERLNGNKRLVRGNHDIMKINEYRKYFGEVYGVRVLEDMILSHIPLHPESVTERFSTNVHGHLHANKVMTQIKTCSGNPGDGNYVEYVSVPDPRYLCVCVEHTDYTPISIEEVRQRIKQQREDAGYEPSKPWGNGTGPN